MCFAYLEDAHGFAFRPQKPPLRPNVERPFWIGYQGGNHQLYAFRHDRL